jgi:hypothetical protein
MTDEPDDVDSMVEPVVPSRHRWLAGLLEAQAGDRVVDLGCGTGGTLAQVAPAVPGGWSPASTPLAGRAAPPRRPGGVPVQRQRLRRHLWSNPRVTDTAGAAR